MSLYEKVFLIDSVLAILAYSFSCVDWLVFSYRSQAKGRTRRFFMAIAASAFSLAMTRWLWLSVIGNGIIHRLYPDIAVAGQALFFSLWVANEIIATYVWIYLVWLLRGGNGETAGRESQAIHEAIHSLREAASLLPAGPERDRAEAALAAYKELE